MLGRGGHDGWFAAPWVRYGAALSALSMVALVIHDLEQSERCDDQYDPGIVLPLPRCSRRYPGSCTYA
jgi:hypothetical protein